MMKYLIIGIFFAAGIAGLVILFKTTLILLISLLIITLVLIRRAPAARPYRFK